MTEKLCHSELSEESFKIVTRFMRLLRRLLRNLLTMTEKPCHSELSEESIKIVTKIMRLLRS